MKKLIPLLLYLLLPSYAYAYSGPYLGADILVSNAQHKYYNRLNNADSLNGTKVDGDDVGWGVSAGFRGEMPSGFILGQEIFFDQLDVVSYDFNYPSDGQKQDTLTVNNRFGVKFKLGYQFTQRIEVIADLGVVAVDYDSRSPSTNQSHGSTKAAMLYGLGIYYKINPRLTLRAHYDYQSVKTRYVSWGINDALILMVGKVGFSVNF